MCEGPETWGMHGRGVTYFAEYMLLAAEAGFGDYVDVSSKNIGFNDALIVLDMQNDFMPKDELNPEGGRFPMQEADGIVPLVVDLMDHFAACGGAVALTRDYHPSDHCSFIDAGGPYPTHCLQDTSGSEFYEPIADCIQRLRGTKTGERQVDIFFKGFHEDIDSFGALPYRDSEDTRERLSSRETKEKLGGCSLCDWTGAFKLKCTDLEHDPNAVPDILAAHRRISLSDWLATKRIDRIFVCGLSFDLSVLDTAANATHSGFLPGNVFIIFDATRASHLPGIGKIGTGFLQDPLDLKPALAQSGLKLIPTGSVLPNLQVVNPVTEVGKIKQGFPSRLGPFSLVISRKLSLYFDRVENSYTAVAPMDEIRSLESRKIEPKGMMSKASPLTISSDMRKALKIPETAVEFCWAYPVGQGTLADQARAYFSISTPSAAFFVYGGFIYFDKLGRAVAVMAVSLGEGLSFDSPQPWRGQFSSSLEGRWCSVTAPYLRERGAKLFAWIHPGEVLKTTVTGEKWTVSEHGAFVYLFHEDLYAKDDRDVVFAVNWDGASGSGCKPANVGCAGMEEEAPRILRRVRKSFNIPRSRSSSDMQEMMDIFRHWDTDKSGGVSECELAAVLKELDPAMSDDAISRIFAAANASNTGKIEFNEFLKWVFAES